MKKVIVFLIIVSIISVLVYQTYFKKEKAEFALVEVIRGDVVEEVSETGQVKKKEEVNLSFKTAGIIEEIYVEVGQEVKEGESLAKLENSQLKIQLEESKANLELNQAKLDKLLAGSTKEEIQVAQTSVDNANISLVTANQNLEDIKKQGEDNLKAAYEDALNVLDDSELKIYNALNTADSIQRTYFTTNDQESIKVKENRDKIETALNNIKTYLDEAKADSKNEDIDTALSEMKKALEDTYVALKIIREICEEPLYRGTVSSTDKSSLDTDRGYINTALTDIVDSQQTISSTKITNEVNLNTYQGKVDVAEGELKAAEDNLAKTKASPRQEDIDLNQAQVRQARAKVQLLEKQIEDTVLENPVDGQVIGVNKSAGEIVQSTAQDAVITLLPASPFKIEVDIYEEDIAKMNVGNPVEISLVAFLNEDLEGRITIIDPAEKMIEGVVYYEVSISFDNPPLGVKPGMTADLVIKTALRENVLVVPESAIREKEGKIIVEVLEGDNFKEQEIEVGLRGSNDIVEVLSGLEEGKEVVIR